MTIKKFFKEIKLFFKFHFDFYKYNRKYYIARKKISEKYHGVFIHPTCIIDIESVDLLEFEQDVYIGPYTSINVFNENEGISNSFLKIGGNTSIGEFNSIRACGGKILIGNKVQISQHVNLIASNHSTVKNIPIRDQSWSQEDNFIIIEDDVWIGAGVVILPGSRIKKGAVIAAGSVVTGNIEEYVIAAGIPAVPKKVRK